LLVFGPGPRLIGMFGSTHQDGYLSGLVIKEKSIIFSNKGKYNVRLNIPFSLTMNFHTFYIDGDGA